MLNPTNIFAVFNKSFANKYSNYSKTEITAEEQRIGENIFNYFENSLFETVC
jgi:hypothetical protein